MRIVVAIHEESFWTIPDEDVARLAALLPGDEIVHVRHERDLAAAIELADIVVGTRVTKEEFARAHRLRWLHSTAVGVGNMLFPEMVASPIPLTNSRGVHAEPIAEHAITLLLALRRGLQIAGPRQAAREWAQRELYRHVVPVLSETTVTVVGLGAIGSRVAAHASALGMTVLAVRRDTDAPAVAGVEAVLPAEQLTDALRRSHAVILALPHTRSAGPLLNAPTLSALKRGAFVVNVARGQLIDEGALAAALESGQIGGAALDAFVPEPLPASSPLWSLPNVIITPHTAAFGIHYWRPAIDLFVENRRRFEAGLPLVNLVDKARGY